MDREPERMVVTFKNGKKRKIIPDNFTMDNEPSSKYVDSFYLGSKHFSDEEFLSITSFMLSNTTDNFCILYRPASREDNTLVYGGIYQHGKFDFEFTVVPQDVLFISCRMLYYISHIKLTIINLSDVDADDSPAIHEIIARSSMFLMDGPRFKEVPIPFQFISLSQDRWETLNNLPEVNYFGNCSQDRKVVRNSYTSSYHAMGGAHVRFPRLIKKLTDSDAYYTDLYILFTRALFDTDERRAAFSVTVLFKQYGQLWVLDHRGRD
jgi:hypothetical protein